MTNEERARRWIEDRDLGRATVESDVVSLAMQFDKVREVAREHERAIVEPDMAQALVVLLFIRNDGRWSAKQRAAIEAAIVKCTRVAAPVIASASPPLRPRTETGQERGDGRSCQ